MSAHWTQVAQGRATRQTNQKLLFQALGTRFGPTVSASECPEIQGRAIFCAHGPVGRNRRLEPKLKRELKDGAIASRRTARAMPKRTRIQQCPPDCFEVITGEQIKP